MKMPILFLIKVKSEINNQSNFARVHNYIRSFSQHFGEPPILADPRRLKVVNEIFMEGINQPVERSASRGIRYYILKDTNLGQVIYLLIKDIFDGRVEILIPYNFTPNLTLLEWYQKEKQKKTKRGKLRTIFLWKETVEEIENIQRDKNDKQ